MSIIKNLEKGLYEFTNYFKISSVTDVPDLEVKRVTPFRGAITNSGDLIEAEYINTVAQAGVWWIKTTKDTTVSGYEKFTTDIVIEQTLVDGFKFKTKFPTSNASSTVKILLKGVEYPVKKVVSGAVVDLAIGDITAGAIANITFVNDIIILEGENLASATVPGIITENRVEEIANTKTNTTLATWCPFPVGAIYMSTTSVNPGTFWTNTTWQAFATGKTIIGIDTSDTDFNSVNKTGGSKEVVLTVPNLPVHSHTVGDNSHSHTANGVGDHSHTLNDHAHYLPPHQHGTGWGERDHTGYWGNWPGGSNYRGSGSTDMHNSMFLTSPVDQWTNGAGAVGMSGSGAHSHTINATTHSHTLSNTGSNTAHSNLQPYVVTYIWKRIS
jgi:microcystin-dependent protein